MAFVNLFAPATAALRSNAAAFKVIGDNIANAVTPGYKAADTRFSEVLASNASSLFDSYGGTRPVVQNFIDRQGTFEQTQRAFDLAINGRGFLVSNTTVDGSGEYQLGRAGQLVATNVSNGGTDETYLTDVTGNFILGWPADASGAITTSPNVASLEAIRIDPESIVFDPVVSTAGSFSAILNAAEPAGTVWTGSLPVIDAEGGEHSLFLQFTKSATPNTWDMTASVSDGTITAGGTATLTFDATGALVTPTNQSIGIAFAGTGGATTFDLDLSATQQLSGAFDIRNFSQNGIPAGSLQSLSFDQNGVLSALFTNGQSRAIYQLPVGIVPSANLLEPVDGTHFAVTDASGALTLIDASASGIAAFTPGALEQSTTDIATEFNKMILTQQSYSTAVRAYTVAEEMMEVATQLKA
jgi:flagellar hook protein FlgE